MISLYLSTIYNFEHFINCKSLAAAANSRGEINLSFSIISALIALVIVTSVAFIIGMYHYFNMVTGKNDQGNCNLIMVETIII